MQTDLIQGEIEISIICEDKNWPQDFELRIQRAIKKTVDISKAKIIAPAELSILLTNDAAQKALNKQWRNIDKSTNVLSFPSLEPFSDIFGLVGDISLAIETLRSEAKELAISFDDHFIHLIVHGFLHLLGYDHLCDEEALEMESLEIKILAQLDIENPYQLDQR